MAFTRPTLKELIERVRGDIRGELGISAILRRSFLAAIGRATAGLGHSLHGHLKEISKQAFPDQATGLFLKRWGSIYGIPARQATYTRLQISGVGTDGTTLPQGTIFTIDNGETYTVDEDVEVASGVYEVGITAVNPGSSTNLNDGETVSLQSPVAGIDEVAIVDSTTIEGEDTELEESHQQRIVARIQEPPAGGRVPDYIAWALEVAGVSRVWVFPGNRGQGTTDLAFLELSGGIEGIPGAPKIAEVQTHINEEKPTTANSVVFAPNQLVVDIEVRLKPNTAAVRAAVTAELQDLFQREGQVSGAADPEKLGSNGVLDGKIALSKFDEAISIADGEDDHILVLPTADIEPDYGFIPVLGSITFSTLV